MNIAESPLCGLHSQPVEYHQHDVQGELGQRYQLYTVTDVESDVSGVTVRASMVANPARDREDGREYQVRTASRRHPAGSVESHQSLTDYQGEKYVDEVNADIFCIFCQKAPPMSASNLWY